MLSWGSDLNLPSTKFVNGLTKYQVTGEVLLALDENDLKSDFGVTSSVERKLIAAALGKVGNTIACVGSQVDGSNSAAEILLKRFDEKDAQNLADEENKRCECGLSPSPHYKGGGMWVLVFDFVALFFCLCYKLVCTFGWHGFVMLVIGLSSFFILLKITKNI